MSGPGEVLPVQVELTNIDTTSIADHYLFSSDGARIPLLDVRMAKRHTGLEIVTAGPYNVEPVGRLERRIYASGSKKFEAKIVDTTPERKKEIAKSIAEFMFTIQQVLEG